VTRDRERATETALDELARRLPRAVEPPAELWLRVAARLDAREACSLEQRARELPTDIPPPAYLWQQIETRLRAEPRRPHTRARLLAAAIAAAAVAALVAVAVRDADPGANGDDSPVRVAADGGSADAEPGTALGTAWMLRSPEISAEVAATLQRDLALVRDERLTIEAAIDREPDDIGLRELWAHTYLAELELTDAWSRTVMAYERG
jgi:hypothetical protein